MKPNWTLVGIGVALVCGGWVMHLCGVAWGKDVVDVCNAFASLLLTGGTVVGIAGLFGVKIEDGL
jgi:hypothetical protein